TEPQLQIVQQPRQRGMRFRYECEGRSAGSIPGEHSTDSNRTFPAVQILNYKNRAKIRVSLVTKSDPPKPHPHSLVGRDCRDGICEMDIGPDSMIASFSNLGIQCVRRREIMDALQLRLKKKVDPFNGTSLSVRAEPHGFSSSIALTRHPFVGTHHSHICKIVHALTLRSSPHAVGNAALDIEDMDLNVVRLCFEAFVYDSAQNVVALPPVVSHEIRDRRATSTSELKICRVSQNVGSVRGGDEIFLLCDKVQREDIEVRFFDDSGWEARGLFSQTDVHRQVAIVFTTPPYRDQAVTREVTVRMQLRRPTDNEVSDSMEFRYLP
uniref:V-rel avian reticuloendotheliosis viral oncogene homolog n=1 Tax=Petromyzon marinus TaxID=7757 RepID=S4RMI8_PETMA